MLLEILGFWGLLCLAMFLFAEWKDNNVAFGAIASILLVILGVWLLSEPLKVQSGENLVITQATNTSIANYTTQTSTTNSTFVYSDVTAPFFTLNTSLGIIFMLLGALAGLRYAFKFKLSW